MRKTKLYVLWGRLPTSPAFCASCWKTGMNVARFNFSHGDYANTKAVWISCAH